MLHLIAEPGAYPLAFEVGELLTGTKTPQLYLQGGLFASPESINRELSTMAGLVDVRIHVEGKYDANTPVTDPLLSSTETFSTFGPLSPETLGRAIHGIARRIVEANQSSRGETPKEIYVTEILVALHGELPAEGAPPEPAAPEVPELPEQIEAPAPRRRPRKRKPVYVEVVRYRDRESGHYVGEAKWKRSRAAKRGAAKRAGKRAGAGRYVRVVERRRVR